MFTTLTIRVSPCLMVRINFIPW